MKPFDVKTFAKQIRLGNGKIRSRKDAEEYIRFGNRPEILLLHFKMDNETLQYILAQIAIGKTNFN